MRDQEAGLAENRMTPRCMEGLHRIGDPGIDAQTARNTERARQRHGGNAARKKELPIKRDCSGQKPSFSLTPLVLRVLVWSLLDRYKKIQKRRLVTSRAVIVEQTQWLDNKPRTAQSAGKIPELRRCGGWAGWLGSIARAHN